MSSADRSVGAALNDLPYLKECVVAPSLHGAKSLTCAAGALYSMGEVIEKLWQACCKPCGQCTKSEDVF